jgi:hypothetical protein
VPRSFSVVVPLPVGAYNYNRSHVTLKIACQLTIPPGSREGSPYGFVSKSRRGNRIQITLKNSDRWLVLQKLHR